MILDKVWGILGSECKARRTLSLAKSPVVVEWWVDLRWKKLKIRDVATASWGTPAWIGEILNKKEPDRMVKCLLSR